jgi:hypothetical protein
VARGLPHDAPLPTPGAGRHHALALSSSRVCGVFWEAGPPFSECHDDRVARRLGLTACAGAERRRPFSTALARTPTIPAPRVPQDALAVETHGQRLLPRRTTPWRGAPARIPTASTAPARGPADFPGSAARLLHAVRTSRQTSFPIAID